MKLSLPLYAPEMSEGQEVGDVKYSVLPPSANFAVIEPADTSAFDTTPSLVVTDHPPLDDAKEEDARLEPGVTPRPFSEAMWGLRYCAASFKTLAEPVQESKD
jgi:hypothetical protein